MRRTGVIRSTLPILVCLAAIACGAKSRPANDPSSTTPAGDTSESAQPTETAAGQDFDEMQFQEPKDRDNEAAERTPPPTKSWKPLDKEKPSKNARQPADAAK